MDIQHRLHRWFKPRFAIVYPFGFFVVFFCSLTQSSLKKGIGYILAGMLIRLWSNGYAIKNDKLTTSGPYAFVRNPLYLGTFLIALGFAVSLNMGWIWGGLFIAGLAFTYYNTIQSEQGMLMKKFGDAYKDYCQKVPAMIPTLIPYNKGEKWPFNLQRLINSKEHKPAFWIVILIILFHFKTRLIIEHKEMSIKSWYLVALAALLIAIDITYEFNKKKFQPKA